MAITEFNYFCADAIGVSAKFLASVDDEQAEGFVKKLFSEYENGGSPKNRKKWLADRLKNTFLCMDVPPKWVGEPRWAYSDDEPMVFLHQFKVDNLNSNMDERFCTGDTIFIFGSKTPPFPNAGESWSVAYRLIVQTEEGEDLILPT